MHFTAASILPVLATMALATLAGPTRLPPARGTTPPPKASEFSLAMNTSGYLVPLTAAYFESRGVLLRGAGTHDPDPETPAYKNTTFSGDDQYPDAVVLDLTNDPYVSAPPGVYGLFAADPGGSHGFVAEVMATIDLQHFDFRVADGRVGHKMTSGSQAWFACTRTIEGVEGAFLSWGSYEANYSAPYGCVSTDVVVNLNLTRGAGSSWS